MMKSTVTLALVVSFTMCLAGAAGEEEAAVQNPPTILKSIVDPHPPDPVRIVDGRRVSPKYAGPARGKHVLPICDYYNETDMKLAFEANPTYVAPIPSLRGRNELATVAQCEDMKIGAELGVQRGIFAEHMLRNWPACTEYHLVDLWAQQENYVDDANVDNNQQNTIMQTALRNTQKYREKVKVCRNFTTECAKRFPDNYFDFVYVDARHDRTGVLEDLEAWWPKIKRGGIIAGHDYVTLGEIEQRQDWTISHVQGMKGGSRDQTGGTVRGAVDDWFMSPESRHSNHHRQVNPCYREMTFSSWSVRK